MALTGSTNEEKIWNYLKNAIGNEYGAAGLMGNLYAESGLNPQNLQNSYEKKLGYTDAEYTAAVDANKYRNFDHDSAGYGLAQWTYWSRKQNLHVFAKDAGKSIGDLEMQLDFLMKELKGGYSATLTALKNARAVKTASNAVLLGFEKPAKKDDPAVQEKRASYGQQYYKKYAGKAATEEKETTGGTSTMSLIFGSARIAETGHAGWEGTAQAGDQKQTASPDYKGEVSMQSYYTSDKGWYVFRAKDPETAEKIAAQMIKACNNANIGYDQSQRDTLWNYIKNHSIKDMSKVASKVETDCSALVRACVYIATGKDVGNIRTVTMPSMMPKSGLFLDTITYKSGTTLYNGDILVTKTSGHTGIICSGNPRKAAAAAKETASSSAFSAYKVKVTASDYLNIRKTASTSAAIVGYLNKGHIVTIRKESDGWGYVDCYSDKDKKEVTGWIFLKYTEKTK